MSNPTHISELLKQFDKEFIKPIREKIDLEITEQSKEKYKEMPYVEYPYIELT